MGNIYDDDAFFAAYGGMDRSREGLAGAGEWAQLRPLFPDLRGLDVLDLGCGYGWHCEYAAQQGAASVLGIDASRRMIQTAEERNSHPKVVYRCCGLEEYDYPTARFDLVVSNLVLHYMADLPWVYRQVRNTLRPGGVFLFNIEHPVFTAGVGQSWILDGEGRPLYWPVDNYFLPGPRETVFLGQRVVKEHHTLTQILGGLLQTGFCMEAIEEAQPPQALRKRMPEELRRPMMLLVRARRP